MKLTEIKVESSLQGRCKLNQEVVDEYSEVLREGGKLPAIKVFRIGSSYYLVDGWHRYFAHKHSLPSKQPSLISFPIQATQ